MEVNPKPSASKALSSRAATLTAAAIYMAVGALFVAKYAARVTEWWPLLTGMWTAVSAALTLWLAPALSSYGRRPLSTAWIKCALTASITAFAGMALLQGLLDPMSIKVDRWSALNNPISYLLDGRYPYMAQTHLGGYGSPFPVWQLLHIPFYLSGNVGLSFFAFLALWGWSIWHIQGRRAAVTALVLMACQPAVWYETAVRSDLMANILLATAAANLVLPHLNGEWMRRHFAVIAIVVALLASTRLLTMLPAVVLLLPAWSRSGLKSQLLTPVIFALVFIATFLPLAVWDPEAFFHFPYNPWVLQTRQGSALDFIIFVPAAIALAMWWRRGATRYFTAAAALTIIVVGVSFGDRMISTGDYALFSASYDITYFSSCLPLVVTALSAKKC